MKKSHLYSKLEFSIVFLLIGIIFTTVSVIFIVFDFNIRNNWVESTGIISSVNHSSEKIEFTYNYNGYSYEFKSSTYYPFIDIGDSIDIYINPDNPNTIYESSKLYVILVFFVFGVPILILGIVFFKQHLKFMIIRKRCLNTGRYKRVKVLRFEETSFNVRTSRFGRYSFNRRYRPYYVMIVEYQGLEYKSNMYLPEPVDICFKNATVDFYYISEENYFIDVASIKHEDSEEF